MSAPSSAIEPLTDSQLDTVTVHVGNLDDEINRLLAQERSITAHALARLAVADDPACSRLDISGIDAGGQFTSARYWQGSTAKELSLTPAITSTLASMLARLPAGHTGAWFRRRDTASLDIAPALALTQGYPFQPVQDRLVSLIEDKTGRSIRRIEITSELWENEYFYCDLVDVDFTDGDSDEISIEELNDFASDIQEQVGTPGANTVVTFVCAAGRVTMR
ncbi:hypothetical protein ABIE52_006742 [Rhodococcus sp. OAS809]|uniref:hypothetical protein n=1 Tax=Rhodococcus sp. OAS809 TaxID=2663874 RepID=UPI00178AF5E1